MKEFRLLADVLNDVGLTLDMALPLLLTRWSSFSFASSTVVSSHAMRRWLSALWGCAPSLYLVVTSASTLCKVACGMAAGATKGAPFDRRTSLSSHRA